MFSNFTFPQILASLLLLALASSSHAIAPSQIDDFQDGTTQGWSSSSSDPTPPVNQPNVGSGGLGDNALFIDADAFESIAIQNSTQWTGDYISAGVDEILFDFENLNGNSISLGATISGPGGIVVTLAGESIPASAGWTAGSIDLSSTNLFALSGTISSTLANVTLLELDHIVAGSNLVSAGAVQIRLDNIQVVPEPCTVVMLALGGLFLAQRHRKS